MDLDTIPAGTPPMGVIPEFVNPESLGSTTISIFAILMTLTVILVTCRVSFNYYSAGGLRLDDYSSIAAAVLSIAQSSIVLSLTRYERHQWDAPLSWLDESYFKRLYAQDLIAWPAIFFAKLAILLLYLRIFTIKRPIRYAIYAGIVWASLTYLPNMAVSSYYCAASPGQPWDFTVGTNCAKPTIWLIAQAVMSVILDLYIFLLPIHVMLRLQMSTKRRWGVLAIFMTASFAIVCAVASLVYRIQLYKDTDALWITADLFICNGVENYIAIIVGTMPAFSGFFKSHILESQLYASLRSRLTSGSRSSSSPSGKWNDLASYTRQRSDQEDSLSDSKSNLRAVYELREPEVTTGSWKSSGITKSVTVEQSSYGSSHV